MNRREFALTTTLSLGAIALPARAQTPGFWDLLREGGCVVLMRHAQTDPGVGDPPNFKLGECSTQRNLSEAGREQARRVGAAFMRERVKLDQVRSSAWCRCVDTAMLAFGQNTVWTPINSFFGSSGGQDDRPAPCWRAVQGWQGAAQPDAGDAPGERDRADRRVPGHGRDPRDPPRHAGRRRHAPARAGPPDLLTQVNAAVRFAGLR